MSNSFIDTERASRTLRQTSIDLLSKKVLVARISGSDQEADLTEAPNCHGFGRLRHFSRRTANGWPENPLPIDPAAKALGLAPSSVARAQVFQVAGCNWRCWYCYVPFALLSADPKRSAWFTADELVEMFAEENPPPPIIDLSGGQPDLTPEWIPWMMRALLARGLENEVYLWSDDNLSNDYLWRHLDDDDIGTIKKYRNYGKVCCFKGFDCDSFAFNTKAHPSLFDQQFVLFRRNLELSIDMYAYVTLTTASDTDIESRVREFVDRLQEIHPNLPLRTVPLEIRVFSPVVGRMNPVRELALVNQVRAVHAWTDELTKRFSSLELRTNMVDVPLSLQ